MNISITGNLGSGKSSICRILREKGYEVVSAGTIFRDLAMEQNLSVEDFNRKVNEDIKKGDHSVDDLIDRRTARLDASRSNIVFDSRLAWHFAPRSFKVFLIVDLDEAARRVYHDSLRSDSESYASVEVCRKALIHRQELEKQRFRELYGVDYFSMENYNLVIESTFASPGQLAEQILARFVQYQSGTGAFANGLTGVVDLNPSSIFPTLEWTQLEWTPIRQAQAGPELVIGQAGKTWFALQGHSALLSAWKTGKVFLPVRVDPLARPAVLTKEAYQEYERQTGRTFRKYPDESTGKETNLLQFGKGS
jgi:cytidylate kinase